MSVPDANGFEDQRRHTSNEGVLLNWQIAWLEFLLTNLTLSVLESIQAVVRLEDFHLEESGLTYARSQVDLAIIFLLYLPLH